MTGVKGRADGIACQMKIPRQVPKRLRSIPETMEQENAFRRIALESDRLRARYQR